MELWKQEYENEITALKVEITDIKVSHKKYDDLSIKHQKLLQINAQQKKNSMKSQAAHFENQGFKKIEKLIGLSSMDDAKIWR